MADQLVLLIGGLGPVVVMAGVFVLTALLTEVISNAAAAVLMVPFGPATMTIEGFDASDAMTYRETFDTFVGAGPTNQELVFDVDPVAAGAARDDPPSM